MRFQAFAASTDGVARTTRRIAATLIASIASCSFGLSLAWALNAYQYVSPVPSSTLVSPWNNVAIRHGEPIDAATIDPALLSVVGSESGAHHGTLALSDDQQTLVFTPDHAYALGESVSVTLARGTRTITGNLLPVLAFGFTVSPSDPASRPPVTCDEVEALASGPRPVTRGSLMAAGVSPPRATLGSLPPNYPLMTLLSMDHPDSGFVFLTPMTNENPAALVIVDNHMMPIFYRRAPYHLFNFEMQPSGLLTYYDYSLRKFYGLDSTYTVVDSFKAGNGYIADNHDLTVLPNGHALLIIYDVQPVRMDRVVEGGDPDAMVSGLILQEIDQTKHVVFQWRSWDHFAITDAVNVDLTASFIDYVHANAIERDTDGNLLLSSRHLNEITKINRSTGAIMWRFGGNSKNNDFLINNDPRGFAYQHDIRRLPNGDITLFDNGNFMTPQESRAVEYQLDEQNMVATLVWESWPSNHGWGNSNGSVQRRANGSTMISWGAGTVMPDVIDLHADDTKALELHVDGTSYRAFRYPWETRRFVTDVKSLDFHAVRVGDTGTLALRIRNRTAKPVTITSFESLDSAFSVTNPIPVTLPPLGTIVANVAFRPDTLGPFIATLYIRSDTETEIIAQDVNVQGEGVTGVPEAAVLAPNGGDTYTAGGAADLQWIAAQGVGVTIADIELSRTGPDGPFETIASGLTGSGTYSWPAAGPATTNAYLRVVVHDSEGQWVADLSDTAFTIVPFNTAVGDPAHGVLLAPLVPNPTRSAVQVEYAVARPAVVQVSVWDLSGRRVAVLAAGPRDPGRYRVSWDCSTGRGRVPPGVYLVRYESPATRVVRRLVVMR